MRRDGADIPARVGAIVRPEPRGRLGVAVSGGSDSVALLHVLHTVTANSGTGLYAATIDHGLRPDAAAEAEAVADLCRGLGVPHSILRWTDWDGNGNLQDRARRARYRLLSDWAVGHGIAQVAVGHTADDQAETVLMRLGRSSGVTGLAAMPVRRTLHGITILRPLLDITRDELRTYLEARGIGWVDDPSNDDPSFARVRARRALAGLADLDISARTLADVARNMAQARDALDWYSFVAAKDCVQVNGGDVVIDLRRFRTLPEEIARRLLIRSMGWINRSDYPPRRAALTEVMDAVRFGRSATLRGCRIVRQGDQIWVCREYNAVRALSCPPNRAWDGRWRLIGPACADCELRALGARGLTLCPDWRRTGRPSAALQASPAVWRGEDLVAAPMAGHRAHWHAELIGGSDAFYDALLSH